MEGRISSVGRGVEMPLGRTWRIVLPGLVTVVGDAVPKSKVFSERKVNSPGVDALGILVRVVILGELPRSGYVIKLED